MCELYLHLTVVHGRLRSCSLDNEHAHPGELSGGAVQSHKGRGEGGS